MRVRNDNEVYREVAALKFIKEFVPQTSYFGDDNHESIEMTIHILENRLGITELEHYVYCLNGGKPTDTEVRMFIAKDAYAWLNLEEDDAPSTGWAAWEPTLN